MESHPLPEFRFAVGIFDSWETLRGGVRDLSTRGLGLESLNCLGLRSVFAHETTMSTAPLHDLLCLREFAFPRNSGPIACTAGPLAERLGHAAHAGAASLSEALATWLVPRHADYLHERAEAGNMQLWVRVVDADDERGACHSLLALSSGAVGVHDLVGSCYPREHPE